jgi:hypothetical protein
VTLEPWSAFDGAREALGRDDAEGAAAMRRVVETPGLESRQHLHAGLLARDPTGAPMIDAGAHLMKALIDETSWPLEG